MTTLIWDFDGTLVDSYEAIGEALKDTYAHYDLTFNEEWVMSFIIKESVKALLYKVAKEEDLDFAELSSFFKKEQEASDHKINPMPHMAEILKQTKQAGVSHFVYTHKGITANDVLERLGVHQYFTEVVTSANGFARKPEPEAIDYLLEKSILISLILITLVTVVLMLKRLRMQVSSQSIWVNQTQKSIKKLQICLIFQYF